MPGFPDKFMPSWTSRPAASCPDRSVGIYGSTIRNLRRITTKTVDKEPKWRTRGDPSTHRSDPQLAVTHTPVRSTRRSRH